MKIYTGLFKKVVLSSSIISLGFLAGCSDINDTAEVRVIHASPDAPAVNVKLDGIQSISNLDYAESSGYLTIDAMAQDIAVEAILPGANTDVITVSDFNFTKNSKTTIIAVNNTNTIEPLVAAESAASPQSNQVAISVVHGSPAAAQVDVYVTDPSVNINSVNANFSFDYKDVIDAGALPAGTYNISVTAPGTKTVVFDSGPVDLSSFAGQKIMLIAMSTTNSIKQAASDIKLVAATDTAQLSILDKDTTSGARVVHLSPDAGTLASGPVEVFATSTALPGTIELISSFSYTDIVPSLNSFAAAPSGDYVFDVAADGAGKGSSVFTSPTLSLSAGSEYTVVAAGYVLTTPSFELLATEDNNRSVITQASVKVIHAAPAAGTVDVYVTAAGDFTTSDVENGLAGTPLLPNFEYRDIEGYVAVAPGNYDIRVVAGGTIAINVENFNLAAGSVSSIIAREPIDSGSPADFNVVLLTN